MSTSEDDGAIEEALRTVTPLTTEGPNLQMNVVGYLVMLPILFLLLPLLPFAVLYLILSKGAKALRG
ncbi:hypothetical protein HLRTI_000243 [Halorhabdus tiamatea SARL4B]|uniref:Uncharacterized protein n=1 Tax=Halorhabdus tiamatea SARL4B TaxID=1033806 RepID=F7PJZ1_9EURY|nr:hypothetical protein [Halorhabdus tiamatea]ERJ07520.1 hypothetical protein HLRTI_000243 [Halorhabdus tiamatea SARL4B]CCQ33532.1 hypothetical protein HTIA_1404 [Halorhabdus tiamatea SARL4B]